MRLWKPPHTGLSHDADVSFMLQDKDISTQGTAAVYVIDMSEQMTSCHQLEKM
jgi:hypothetical protein